MNKAPESCIRKTCRRQWRREGLLDLGLQEVEKEGESRAGASGRLIKEKRATRMVWDVTNGEHGAAALPGRWLLWGRRLLDSLSC
jgi:hypothetical protein